MSWSRRRALARQAAESVDRIEFREGARYNFVVPLPRHCKVAESYGPPKRRHRITSPGLISADLPNVVQKPEVTPNVLRHRATRSRRTMHRYPCRLETVEPLYETIIGREERDARCPVLTPR